MLIFSVVIPTYNRRSQLRQCLEALAEQDFSREAFEVIVVDDGGNDVMNEIYRHFQDKLVLIFLRQQKAGPASARNMGARHAKGRYIAFTGDDCVPARDWLQRLSDCLTQEPDQLYGGRIINGFPQNVYSVASQLILDVVYTWQWKATARRFFTTNNLSLAVVVPAFDQEAPDSKHSGVRRRAHKPISQCQRLLFGEGRWAAAVNVAHREGNYL